MAASPVALASDPARAALRQHALRLEYATVAWNVLEALVAIAAALAAGSVALLAFGIDSCVETSSGLILIWRLRAEAHARSRSEIERLDHRARRLVGVSLFALAAWVSFDATSSLLGREAPEPSLVGVALLVVSLGVMLWLARAKRRAARALGSRALESDAFQTTACWWLSLVALSGLALNAALGWWWADPVAALAMVPLIVHEAREAWAGEACGCEAPAAAAASEAAEGPLHRPEP